MSVLRRVVLDTGTLVSAALRVGSVPHQALLKALGSCELCASGATLNELEQVLKRDKFDRYLDVETRLSFVALVRQHAHLFAVLEADELTVQPACRDPKDNQFLTLALACEADAIISSDNDLLALDPWRSIPVLTPAGFVTLNPSHASLGQDRLG
jgi:uncharacterized protein